MTHKHFINAQELIEDAFSLARRIRASDFRPGTLIGVWRGGTPVGIAVHEYFRYHGHEMDHMAVQAISYTGIAQQDATVRVRGLTDIAADLDRTRPILVVDDVFDSGRTMQAIVSALRGLPGMPAGAQIRTACPWYKPARRVVPITPDYYLHETDDWLVFPHELEGLSAAEIRAGKGALAGIVLDP